MGLSRYTKLALAILFFYALTALPAPLSSHHSGGCLTATPAWAGGSPDETLDPHPGKASSLKPQRLDADAASLGVTRTRTTVRLRWTDRVGMVWKFYLASVLRY